MILTVMDGS